MEKGVITVKVCRTSITYAPMDQKRAMMNTDRDIMPNSHLNVAKAPTNSVSMTQLYCNKLLKSAVQMTS